MKKTIIQKGRNNIIIEGDFHGNITIENEYVLAQELTAIPFVDPDEVWGRQEMLPLLKEQLDKSKKPLVLYGVGGIGKSTIAKVFVNQYKKEYDHLVWISVTNSLKISLYDNSTLKKNLKVEEINIDQCVDQILNLIRQIKGKSLLVLDNVDISIYDFMDKLPQSPDWSILATSRVELEDLKCIKIDEIECQSALELFNYFCPKNFDSQELEELLKEIRYHPLSILLYAKAIWNNPDIQSLRPLIEIVKKSRLNDTKLKAKIRLPYSKNESELINHLLSIFDFSSLTESEIDILSCFCYFPSSAIQVELIFYFFSIPPQLENERIQFLNQLDQLRLKGWLETENKNTFKIHRLLQVVFLIHINPPNDKILPFLHQLYYAVRNTGMVNTVDQITYLPFVESALGNHPDSIQNDIFAAIATDSDRLFEFIGRIDDSIQNLEFAIEIWHRFPNPETNLELAKTYHNLGVTYFQYKSNIDKAFEYQQKALEIRENYVTKTQRVHHSLAESYRQISYYFQHLHYFKEAIDFAYKAIEVDKQTMPPSNPQHAANLKILAELHSMIGDWEKCIHYCHLSLEQRKKAIFMDHEEVYDTFLLASQAYAKLDQKDEAFAILQLALEKYAEIIPENSIRWQSIYSQAGDICRSTGRLEQALQYFEKAMMYTQSHFGTESFQYSDLLNNVGLLFMESGNFQEAVASLEISLEIKMRVLGPKHFDLGKVAMNISETLFRKGDFKQAFDYGLFAHEILINHDQTHAQLAFLHRNMAYIQIGLKQPMQARFHMEDCLEFASVAFPDKESFWAKDMQNSKESILQLCAELESQGYE